MNEVYSPLPMLKKKRRNRFDGMEEEEDFEAAPRTKKKRASPDQKENLGLLRISFNLAHFHVLFLFL